MGAREIELKFRLDPAEMKRFISSDLIAGVEPKQKRLHATYFDDQNSVLWKNGYHLRIRKEGSKHIQTLKVGAGLERGEWEQGVAAGGPSFDAVRNTPAKRLVKKSLELRPVFETDVERRTWTVARHGALTEVSLDTGVISAGGRSERIMEAELELKEGDIGSLFDLARQFIEHVDAPPSFVDKDLRGRRLASGRADCAERDIHFIVSVKSPVGVAFRDVATACLRQVSLNEEVLRSDPESVEGVHQMRVAVRRLRATFTLFRTLIEGDEYRHSREELKWLSTLLGEARDLDVLTTRNLRRARLRHPGVHGLEELETAVMEQQSAAHHKLTEALHSLRYRSLLLDIVRFLHAGTWRDNRDRRSINDDTFMVFVKRELDKHLKGIISKKNRQKLKGVDEAARHRLRIKAKKLRYMAEFASAAASSKSNTRIIKQLKILQQALGTVHDGVATEQILDSVLSALPQDAIAAMIVLGAFRAHTDCMDEARSALRQLRTFRF